VFHQDDRFPALRGARCFTDDTVLTLATAQAVLDRIPCDQVYRDLARAYPQRG
jgi:hypothetical protein